MTSGGDDAEAGPLTVRSDDQEKGDPELGNEVIRITPQGLWTRVFRVALEDLEAGEEVLSRVEFQLTWCRGSDRTAASDSSCRGTPTYSFSPTIDWKLLLADERGSSGQPRATGEPIGPSHKMVCTAEIHHCVPVAFGDIKIGERQAGNKFVALVVRARDPQAKPCRPARAANCDVLQLTPDEGRLTVVREQQASLTPISSRNDKELASQLKVAGSKAEKKSFRKVIYSREFSKPGNSPGPPAQRCSGLSSAQDLERSATIRSWPKPCGPAFRPGHAPYRVATIRRPAPECWAWTSLS